MSYFIHLDSEIFALKKMFVAECEKLSKFANLKVQNETQPTISNLPFSQYFNFRTARQVESDLTLTKKTVQSTLPCIGVVEYTIVKWVMP